MPLRDQPPHWPVPMRPAMRRRPVAKECADPQSPAMQHKKLDPRLRHRPLYQLRLQLAVHTEEVTLCGRRNWRQRVKLKPVKVFEVWLKEVGLRPSPKHSL